MKNRSKPMEQIVAALLVAVLIGAADAIKQVYGIK
jgi:hypothetical protein